MELEGQTLCSPWHWGRTSRGWRSGNLRGSKVKWVWQRERRMCLRTSSLSGEGPPVLTQYGLWAVMGSLLVSSSSAYNQGAQLARIHLQERSRKSPACMETTTVGWEHTGEALPELSIGWSESGRSSFWAKGKCQDLDVPLWIKKWLISPPDAEMLR